MKATSRQNKEKQGRQYMYNVTVWHDRLTIVVVEKQLLLHIPSVCLCFCLSYPACKSHIFNVMCR